MRTANQGRQAMQLTVLTYNTLWGGYDGREDRRARAQIELINEVRPDVFLMQAAKGFEGNGAARLYGLEYQLGMRGFLAPALHTGQHVAIFIRPPLRPIAFEADSGHFHHAVATLSVALPGGPAPITFITAVTLMSVRRLSTMASGALILVAKKRARSTPPASGETTVRFGSASSRK